MTRKIIFVKDVEFLDIEKGDIFRVYENYDGRPFIKLKSKMKIYLTPKRNQMGFYQELVGHFPNSDIKLNFGERPWQTGTFQQK